MRRKRRCYTLEERIQKFEGKASPRKVPGTVVRAARQQGLARAPLPDSSPCSRLLDFILANATYGQDGHWYYIGPVRLAADIAQVEHKQSFRCMRRFIDNGLLEKYGRNRKGRPQQYRIHLKTALQKKDAPHD